MKLESYLTKFGISRTEFAALIGVSQPTLHRYLHQARFPRPEIMARIYRATDGLVSPTDFVDLNPIAKKVEAAE